MSLTYGMHRSLSLFGGDVAVQTYEQQVQAIDDLIYYLPLTDAAGTTTLANLAPDEPDYQAAATNVTFGSTDGPIPGQKAADFNGTSSFIDLLTAGTFGADFNGNEYTISLYIKSTEAVWLDLFTRFPLFFMASTSANLVQLRKTNAGTGLLDVQARNAGSNKNIVPINQVTTPKWFNVILKLSDSGDSLVYKINNIIQGTATGISTWPGETPLAWARIGGDNSAGNRWSGSIAQVAVINRYTTEAEDIILSRYYTDYTLDSFTATIDDGAWTWYNDPRAVRSGAKTFIGSINASGDVQVSEYNHSSNTLTTTALRLALQVDDHNNPGLLLRDSDSRIVALYSGHIAGAAYERISTNPLDSTAWGVEINQDIYLQILTYTYSNPIQLTGEANDPIYNFLRGDEGAGWAQYYSTSTDGGETWAVALRWLENNTNRPYLKVEQNGNDRIDFAFTDGHPDTAATSIYHGYYQAGNWYQTDGTLVGGVGDLPFAPAQFTLVYDGTTTRAWIHDVAIDESGYPVIVYATFPNTTTDHRYRYARWNGATWDDNEICTAGGYLYVGQPYYSGGVVLDHSDPDIVFASRNTGLLHQIYRYITADGGASFSETQISGEKSFRPVVARNHSGNPKLLYVAGTYIAYTNYATKIRLRNG